MATALALFNFISSPVLSPVPFHTEWVASSRVTRNLLGAKLLPRIRRSKETKCHDHSSIIPGNFNLADFLQGDWILNKNISYSKLYQDVSGSDGDAIFEGRASFVPVQPPCADTEPHHLWYKEQGSVTMAGRSTVRCSHSRSEFPWVSLFQLRAKHAWPRRTRTACSTLSCATATVTSSLSTTRRQL